eukprot:3478226-Amphidinium_carterae.1
MNKRSLLGVNVELKKGGACVACLTMSVFRNIPSATVLEQKRSDAIHACRTVLRSSFQQPGVHQRGAETFEERRCNNNINMMMMMLMMMMMMMMAPRFGSDASSSV